MPSTEVDSPRVVPRADHPVSRKKIARHALKVLYRLNRAGFKSYVVGGAVRDLMLGTTPKDFDIATDARPGQIRRLFRNSRIIGRRFRLAHIYFHEGIVEVSTFRRDPDPERQRYGPDDPLITDDNVFGSPREDAFRRDFTVNALFYDIADFTVIDYVGGVADLEQQLIRSIGDASMRFQEDPVRMVRACEFAARLGFGIESETQQAILHNGRHLDRAAPARLTEEVVQIMRCGAAGRTMQWMLDLDLLDVILPQAHAMVDPASSCGAELAGMLPAIDRRVMRGEVLSDATLLSVLLLPELTSKVRRLEAQRGAGIGHRELARLIDEVVDPFALRFALSRDRAETTRSTLQALHRLEHGSWKNASRAQFVNRPYFPHALDLLALKVEATSRGVDSLREWRQAARHRSVGAGARTRTQRRGRRSRSRRRGGRRKRG